MNLEAKQKALRMINYGLYIMTCKDHENIDARTVSWVTQISFEPPLIAVGVHKESEMISFVKNKRSFAISVLGSEQKEIGSAFFKNCLIEGSKINGYQTKEGTTGNPVFLATPSYFECELSKIVETEGDHILVLGKVVDAGVNNEMPSLILRETRWNYGG